MKCGSISAGLGGEGAQPKSRAGAELGLVVRVWGCWKGAAVPALLGASCVNLLGCCEAGSCSSPSMDAWEAVGWGAGVAQCRWSSQQGKAALPLNGWGNWGQSLLGRSWALPSEAAAAGLAAHGWRAEA